MTTPLPAAGGGCGGHDEGDVLQRVQVGPGHSLEEVVVAMTRTKASSCAVVDGDGKLQGLLTESDVVFHAYDAAVARQALHAVPVSSLLGRGRRLETGVLKSLATADTYQNMAVQMGRVKSKNLPVLDGSGRYLGTLTALRATRELLRMRDAEYWLAEAAGGLDYHTQPLMVTATATVANVVAALRSSRTNQKVAIVTGEGDVAMGLVSVADVLRRGIGGDGSRMRWGGVAVSTIMTPWPLVRTLNDGEPDIIVTSLYTMIQGGFRHMPVVQPPSLLQALSSWWTGGQSAMSGTGLAGATPAHHIVGIISIDQVLHAAAVRIARSAAPCGHDTATGGAGEKAGVEGVAEDGDDDGSVVDGGTSRRSSRASTSTSINLDATMDVHVTHPSHVACFPLIKRIQRHQQRLSRRRQSRDSTLGGRRAWVGDDASVEGEDASGARLAAAIAAAESDIDGLEELATMGCAPAHQHAADGAHAVCCALYTFALEARHDVLQTHVLTGASTMVCVASACKLLACAAKHAGMAAADEGEGPMVDAMALVFPATGDVRSVPEGEAGAHRVTVHMVDPAAMVVDIATQMVRLLLPQALCLASRGDEADCGELVAHARLASQVLDAVEGASNAAGATPAAGKPCFQLLQCAAVCVHAAMAVGVKALAGVSVGAGTTLPSALTTIALRACTADQASLASVVGVTAPLLPSLAAMARHCESLSSPLVTAAVEAEVTKGVAGSAPTPSPIVATGGAAIALPTATAMLAHVPALVTCPTATEVAGGEDASASGLIASLCAASKTFTPKKVGEWGLAHVAHPHDDGVGGVGAEVASQLTAAVAIVPWLASLCDLLRRAGSDMASGEGEGKWECIGKAKVCQAWGVALMRQVGPAGARVIAAGMDQLKVAMVKPGSGAAVEHGAHQGSDGV